MSQRMTDVKITHDKIKWAIQCRLYRVKGMLK